MNQYGRNIIEQEGQRVLTTAQLAESYGTDNKRISNNFNENKERYTEGKHFFLVEGEELKRIKSESRISGIAPNLNKLYLWTEKGAWLHAKSLNTDAAWDAYEMLVDDYYRVIQQKPLTAREQALLALQVNEETAQRVDVIEEKVAYLHNTMRIDSLQEKQIKQLGKSKVLQALGGSKSMAYGDRSLRSKVFSAMWTEFYNHFEIPNYPSLPRVAFDDAIAFLGMWQPSTSLRMEISSHNTQLAFAGGVM